MNPRFLVAATMLAASFPATAFAQKLPPANPVPIAPLDGADATATGGVADRAAADPALVAEMDRIEAATRLPSGAAPLASYARYYAWADADRTKVTAILLQGAAPGRKWVGFDDLPLVLDGGCAVIELIWDKPGGRVENVYCNGGA